MQEKSFAQSLKEKANGLTHDQLIANAVYSGVLINFMLEEVFEDATEMGEVLAGYAASKGIGPKDMPRVF